MFKASRWRLLGILTALLLPPFGASATTVFDFDDIQPTSKKGAKAPAIEVYMEGLYGSDIVVGPKANGVRGARFYGAAADHLAGAGDNFYLIAGKGKGAPGFTIDFGDNPIDSFSVDFKLFKKAKQFSIFADGELINLQTLSKAQRKTGLTGEQTLFFDTPVQTLQFVGSKKKSFAIDNLVVDLSFDLESLGSDGPTDGTRTINQISEVAEPGSFILLLAGSFGLMILTPRREML